MQNVTPITAKHAYEALKDLGYSKQYVSKLLPDWWDNSLLKTSAGSLQFALILNQRLGIDVLFDQQGELSVTIDLSRTKFKHRRDTQDSELARAASLGRAIARLALHGLPVHEDAPTTDPMTLRKQLLTHSTTGIVNFDSLVNACWRCGIPVLYLDSLPPQSKRPTGMAINVNGRFAIILGHRQAQKSRQLFVLAHELGHITLGHINKDDILIDEDIAEVTESLEGRRIAEQDIEEKEADNFALQLIRGYVSLEFRRLFSTMASGAVLAVEAMRLGTQHQIDPGHLLLSWAKETGQWASASKAIAFLINSDGAMKTMHSFFLQYANLECLSDENRSFLMSVQGFQA
ncbi:MAG: ImmA/IrrE family metallo-endopeptidase [Agitococcus sp.]|nr:ImmA/IrrE family metallo-endopeptidase [Agitococcus sp.]